MPAKKRAPASDNADTTTPAIRHAVVSLAALTPHPRNYRQHPQQQIDRLAASLARFGQVRSIVVQEGAPGHYLIVAGHGLAEAAKQQGYAELRADVIPATWTAEQVEGYLIADNQHAAGAQDDLVALADMLEAQYAADYDLESLGSSREDLDALLDEIAENALHGGAAPRDVDDPDGGGDDFDTTPDKDGGPTRVQPGDLWQLGEHRLLCGDSTKREDVARLMDGERIGLVVTSPPYTDQREYGIGSFDWDALMRGVTDRLSEHLEDVSHVLVNLGPSHKDGKVDMYWLDWLRYCETIGLPLYGWYVWDKGAALPGDWNGRLGPSHEFMFHFRHGRVRANKWIETRDREGGRSTRTFRQKDGSTAEATSPDKFGQPVKVPDSVIRINREAARGIHTENHPAVYPVALPAFVMNTWSTEGDVVYEPFCGSGTTIIAADRLERRCYAIEIEPRYCDVILRRWEAETGREATLLSRAAEAVSA